MSVRTRFAPSPTGFLHIGHARAAVVNFLYAKQCGGDFILRFDDTDLSRSTKEYKSRIEEDMQWLGLSPDIIFSQSTRLERYGEIKDRLLSSGRLYPCFETESELSYKRKLQLSSGKPPIYDRAALKLSSKDIDNMIAVGHKCHYRFLLDHTVVNWHDLIKGDIKYDCASLSDPIVIRENGSMTYMLCSVVDDIDYDITHIIRGEDHITNTAVQIQMFEALDAVAPICAHFSLLKTQDEKISKRDGGFELHSLQDELMIEPMSVNSFFAIAGTSKPVIPFKDLESLAQYFALDSFSKSATSYSQQDLLRLNHKLIMQLNFDDVQNKIDPNITHDFWLAVRSNLNTVSEINDWWNICHAPSNLLKLDSNVLKAAYTYLPVSIAQNTWDIEWKKWIQSIADATGKSGKDIFEPLRFALTGTGYGPELKKIMLLLSRAEILKRLECD